MVAMTGCLIHNADIEFPGYLSVSQQLKFSDIPNGGQGIFAIPPAGLAQILAFCALVELAWWPANKYDGDYGCGFFGATFDAEKKTEKLNAELANGRLAMLGIFGNMVAEAQTGQTFGEQMAAGNMSLFFVDPNTPERASTAVNAFGSPRPGSVAGPVGVDESVIGVQAPAGFWDPLNFSETQPEGFERRRAVERKHGRIAMVAMLGCLIHNADIEFPGYLSVSQQLKFSDIPNGGQGIFAVPPQGLAQILAFAALVELAWWPANKYDGDYGCGFFGAELDAEKKTQKLNAELANGRLAMLGIFGNMVAEAQTGQTFGEQMAAGNMSLFFVDPNTPERESTAVSVIGVQAPAGFWDPLNFSETQPEGFERRRAVER